MDDDFEITGEAQIPYFIHEGEMARMERVNKRWFVAFLIVLIMLFATNAGWILYESQFDQYYVSQEVDTGRGDAFVAGIGDVSYGESEADSTGAGAENQR